MKKALAAALVAALAAALLSAAADGSTVAVAGGGWSWFGDPRALLQGRNLFLRSWTNGIIGVNTNPVTGAGSAVLQFGPRFAQIDYKTSGGTDHYDSLQTTWNRRFSQGLTAGLQWTYGHSIGNTGGSNEAQS